MNINPTSNISCKANPLANAKTIKAPLKDGSEAVIKFTDDAYECLIVKNNKILGGKGATSPNGVKDDFKSVVEKLKDNFKEGFDFLGEFINTVFTK